MVEKLKKVKKQAGFTMAEVLITLGIVGIIAAMTLPQLIKNYQHKVLQTQFKKAYTKIQEAYLLTLNELGVSNLSKEIASCSVQTVMGPEFNATFHRNLRYKTKAKDYRIYNYTKNKFWERRTGTGSPMPVYVLEDGSSYVAFINSCTIFLEFDSNGPYTGPNRYGFDVFTFRVANDGVAPIKSGKLYTEEELKNQPWPENAGNPCTIKSKQATNGIGCSYYAINDISPDDNSKTYWKNLPK